jgi:hypothetical protein
LVGDDFVGHDVVEDGTNSSAGHLHREGHPGCQMAVLGKLEILREELPLNEGIISLFQISEMGSQDRTSTYIEREVHVCNRVAGLDVSAHLLSVCYF